MIDYMAEEALTGFGSRMKYKVLMSDSEEGSPAMPIHRKEEETNNQEGRD